jgi:hypothetical protein
MPDEMSADDRAALIELEHSLWRTETRGDRAYMEKTLAPDFFEFGRSGRTYTRTQTLDARVDPFEATLHNFDLRLIAPGVALVTYVSEAQFGSVTEIGNRSSLWTRSGGAWRLRFHQGTAVHRTA